MTRYFPVLALLISLLSPRAASAADLVIIANSSVGPVAPISLDQVASIYLLRTTRWPDGSHIVPVNREAGSEIRARFVAAVIKEDSAALAEYWNEMHFQGRLPPVVQESEAAVLAFVRNVPGAVGYVSASAPVTGVEVLGRIP